MRFRNRSQWDSGYYFNSRKSKLLKIKIPQKLFKGRNHFDVAFVLLSDKQLELFLAHVLKVNKEIEWVIFKIILNIING